MNRTERAMKRQHRQIINANKREEKRKRYEASFFDGKDLKGFAADERKLKAWHRKILEDYAGNNQKEVKAS